MELLEWHRRPLATPGFIPFHENTIAAQARRAWMDLTGCIAAYNSTSGTSKNRSSQVATPSRTQALRCEHIFCSEHCDGQGIILVRWKSAGKHQVLIIRVTT
jgi:hypothetical protein